MTSCDTNIIFPACDTSSSRHGSARAFLDAYRQSGDFCLCEQVLLELYCLLRNPAVCRNPLSGSDAVGIIQSFRSNPAWRVVDVVLAGEIMQTVWHHASSDTFACRRVFDARLAETLRHHGVTQFATCNAKDFRGFGFERVWNPLA